MLPSNTNYSGVCMHGELKEIFAEPTFPIQYKIYCVPRHQFVVRKCVLEESAILKFND